jgi:hypothetical protein
MEKATRRPSVQADVSLSDCLTEINNALNYWYPLESNGCDQVDIEARHVRLFEFRNRVEGQLRKGYKMDYYMETPGNWEEEMWKMEKVAPAIWAAVEIETGKIDGEDMRQHNADLEELAEGWEWRKFILIPESNAGLDRQEEVKNG